VLELPSKVTLAPTIASTTFPRKLAGENALSYVATFIVLPVAAKLLENEAAVAARLAVGAVLETENVWETGTPVPIADAVS
jgi:hypothetical protein